MIKAAPLLLFGSLTFGPVTCFVNCGITIPMPDPELSTQVP
ncbi:MULTISPECIES: hypothetical protein [Microvirga]|nr:MULTISPECIES: hypothetical protein [unclassified Microvirga]